MGLRARWGLGICCRTEAQGGRPGKERDLGRTDEEERHRDESEQVRPTERSQSGRGRGTDDEKAGGSRQRPPESLPGSNKV